jgi:hypothetical protein
MTQEVLRVWSVAALLALFLFRWCPYLKLSTPVSSINANLQIKSRAWDSRLRNQREVVCPRAFSTNLKKKSCGIERAYPLLWVGSGRVENSAKTISRTSFVPRPLRARSWHRLGGELVCLPACIEGFQSQAVESKVNNEPRPINQIAPPQPSRLLQEPE